jgi:hypothetical protein
MFNLQKFAQFLPFSAAEIANLLSLNKMPYQFIFEKVGCLFSSSSCWYLFQKSYVKHQANFTYPAAGYIHML